MEHSLLSFTTRLRTSIGVQLGMNGDSASSDSSSRSIGLAHLLLGSNGELPAAEGAQLHQTAALYESLLNSVPVSLLIKDAQGRRVFANQRYLALQNTTLEEVLGKTDEHLFSAEDSRRYQEENDEVMRTGQVFRGVEERRLADGRQMWIERFKSPLRDVNGKIRGVQVVFWEVTRRVETETALDRERELLHALMDNIPDFIYFKDRESRFLRISRACADKFQLSSPEEAINKTDADIFTAEHAEQALEDERQIMRTGRPIVGQLEKETYADQEDTWASTTKMPLRDKNGRIVGTFGISRDVTQLKRMQDELLLARDAANAASKAKGDFLANMSHEIRTPMNAIIGMTELLLDTPLDEVQQEYMKIVQESGNALLTLLNDVLDFSRIESGRFELENIAFDLRDSIGNTLKSLGIRAHAKELELAFSIAADVPASLIGDPGRLRQILVNLVGNAIKFTEKGEVVVTVGCELETAHDVTLRFAVRDTGIGIAPEKHTAIFDEFQQADTSTTRNYGGSGLGLAIASRLVRRMGGKITVHSSPGSGSTFSFTVRLGKVPPEAPALAPPEHPVSFEGKVLVVDDNATNRRILFDMLSNWGWEPALASSAQEAFELLQQAAATKDRFRFVLTDVNMPQVDGFELASWIRDSSLLNQTPIVMLTSATRQGDSERRKALQIDAHLLKPIKQSELFDELVEMLSNGKTPQLSAEPSASPSEEKAPLGLRVLLAEDNLVNQKLALGVLRKLGCEVDVANNGREVIEHWQAAPPDVVLMDVQMPEMDGYEATAAIRHQERGTEQHTPIVAMTAHAMAGDREKCLAAGMDDYLSKPVRMQELREKLASLPEIQQNTAERSQDGINLGADDALDWESALEVAGGDSSLLRSALVTFHQEASELLQRLRSDLESREWKSLKRQAHSLRGALTSVGARRAAKIAAALEDLPTTEAATQAADLVHQLDEEITRLGPLFEQGPPPLG